MVFLCNITALENWKYITSGIWIYLNDDVLTPEQRMLKQARLGKIRPLFVVVGDQYYYYDNGYERNTVLDMSDTVSVLNQIKEKLK